MPTCNILPVENPDPTLIRIPAGYIPDFPETEPAAAAHWIFDSGDSACLTDRIGGQALTPVGTVTFPGAFARLAAGAQAALITPYNDADAIGTWVIVARVAAFNTSGTILLGSQQNNQAVGGEQFFVTSAGLVRAGVTTTPSGTIQQANAPGAVELNKPFLAALATSAGKRVPARFAGGAGQSALWTGTKLVATTTRKLALGNAYRTTGYVEQGLDIMEAIFFTGERSLDQLLGTYRNSLGRMQRRGFVLA